MRLGALTVMDLALRLENMGAGDSMSGRMETVEELKGNLAVVKRTLLRRISFGHAQAGEVSG